MNKQQTIVNWFINRRGKLTYSMLGSRNGLDGKDFQFKAGMYFSFAGDEIYIDDIGNGGYYGGYYWRQFEFGQYGTVWLSCWDKYDLVHYYD